MITGLSIKNFKAHQDSDFSLSNLNVFAGRNGMGKSSIIQSLLLLRQSYLAQRNFKGIVLNGDLISIGNSKDAFCESGIGDDIEFELRIEKDSLLWISERNIDKNYLPFKSSPNIPLDTISIFNNNFQYIGAEHLAGKESHSRNTFYVEQLNQISEKNGDCKYTVHYLSSNSERKLAFDALRHPSETRLNLISQVEAWLKEITPGINIKIEEKANLDSISLRYEFETKYGKTNEYKPENVGFGISYILPLLVAILSAQKESAIFVENPESHLHPGGQSVIGRLLCLAAQCGIQFFIETHSDHIINSILINAKKFANTGIGIDKNLVRIYSVDRAAETNIAEITPIVFNDYSVMSNQPDFFFNQIDKDLEELIKS